MRNDIGRMVLVLGVTCIAAALGLSWVEAMTADRIAEEVRKELLVAIEAVLPPFDNAPDTEEIRSGGRRYLPGRQSGTWTGIAIPISSEEGYGGRINALLGVDPGGGVTGVQILTHAETPGLGAKFTAPAYLEQFRGKRLEGTRWAVKKDGGDFDQITGATITPRALIVAMERALRGYEQDREALADALAPAAEGTPGERADEDRRAP